MSPKVVVAGAASLYMALGLEGFPLRYAPTATHRWANVGVAGAACHVARVQSALGNDVELCTLVGDDAAGAAIRWELGGLGLLGAGVVETAASSLGLVLVGPEGQRMGLPHLTPVNKVSYPFNVLRDRAQAADLLVLTNAKFVRPLLGPADELGIPIAVDVHLISDLDGDYNRPWLERAEIVFCSHERLASPSDWVGAVFRRYPRCRIVGVGMGADGALLGLREGLLVRVAAAPAGEIVNTSGAGDALFATFLATRLQGADPIAAIQSGVLHAGWKIGHRLPASVSLSSQELEARRVCAPPPTTVGRWSS
ncbi:carbohydrate kinase family protein [Spirillospora sp. CA-294931]|uniref:carbohydrate kinase family protein n=1 Tax=Spirillospora sp. CA-294931 TaxID=3240042 RepID=UPI003D8BA6E0